MAKARGDDPLDLNQESWRVVKAAHLAPGAYELALRRALLANEAAPWNPEFVRTLGAAYYRLKKYDESLSTMARAARLRSEPDAYDGIFTAMAHQQLGHRHEAREALHRVRTRPADAQALYEEAAALIGR